MDNKKINKTTGRKPTSTCKQRMLYSAAAAASFDKIMKQTYLIMDFTDFIAIFIYYEIY